VRELYQPGDRIKVAGVEGVVEEIGTVKTQILSDDGELVSLANRLLIDEPVRR